VADIAALADVDVPPGQLERGVGAHALHILDGVLEVEERCDLHDPADGDDQEAEKISRSVAFFSRTLCLSRIAIVSGPPYSAGPRQVRPAQAGARFTVIQRL
jgi:hypothetical protein